MRLGRTLVALAAALGMALVAAPAGWALPQPVPGFKSEWVTTGHDMAVGIAWTPDGRMLIAEKGGVLKVRSTTGWISTVLDISGHVNSYADRGLTGIAVDKDYATNNYVYLLYPYDVRTQDDTGHPTTSRLTRIVLKPDNKVANAKLVPETTILGTHPVLPGAETCPAPGERVDCIPADGGSHVVGTVRVAPDGTLFVGTGDAMYSAWNSPDPYRPLNPLSLAGKVMHVDRNGRGVAGHPLCPTETDLTKVCTKVYAQGFRNPFRFTLADRGGLWVGDVGEALYEELDHALPGRSYGWPCFEGTSKSPSKQTSSTCVDVYAKGQQTPPTWQYFHETSGNAIVVGPEIRSPKFPDSWQGSLFVGDIVKRTLNRVEVDDAGKVVAVHPFATNWGGADLQMGPDGHLYSADFYGISRFVPVTGNRPPEARATVTPYAGLAPLEAHFDATTSSDPDGDELTYTWSFGDGTGATGPTPIHTYATNGHYTARLTVTDPSGAGASVELPVVVGTRPPEIEFTKPAPGYLFRGGVPVDLEVSATDPEDGVLPETAVTWTITLQHNQHQHQLNTTTGRATSFTPLTDHDSDSYYLIDVTAVDSDGVRTTRTLRIDPQTVRIELLTDPPVAAELVYGNVPRPAPFAHDATVGYVTTISAPDTVTGPDGETLVFQGWSDGGSTTHDITVPDVDLRLVARYVADAMPPDTYIEQAPPSITRERRPEFRFAASELPKEFHCRWNGGGWQWCRTPYKPPYDLARRKHVFEVRGVDMAGNIDPTPARHEFLVTF